MPVDVFDQIKQQSFLGASIVNWNVNLGYNSSPTDMTINLAIDDRHNMTPDDGIRSFDGSATGEGYHPKVKMARDVAPQNIGASIYPEKDYNGLDHAPHHQPGFPMGALPGYDNGLDLYINAVGEPLYKHGDYFCPPPIGSPVWFSYYLWDDGVGDGGVLSAPSRSPRPVIIQNTYPWVTGSFNGIFTDYTIRNSPTGGKSISVKIQDPRLLLEGVHVVLDGHKRSVAPGDHSTNKITASLTNSSAAPPLLGDNLRRYEDGYSGYYNIANVFGYYENYFKWVNYSSDRYLADGALLSTPGFGAADINEAGMRFWNPQARLHPALAGPLFSGWLANGPGWPSIFTALQHILMGHPDAEYANNEPGLRWPVLTAGSTDHLFLEEEFGGPVYSIKKRDGLINTITSPDNAYRYKVDLSDMKRLFEDNAAGFVPGPLPRYYRVKSSGMSLLQLIDTVCKDANADFTVELFPDTGPPHGDFTGESLDGVIKVFVRLKNRKPDTTIIAKEIRRAEWATGPVAGTNYAKSNPHLPPGLRPHKWFHRLVSHDVGKESPPDPMGKVVYGGPRTRVVGVTELGIDRVREEYCSCYNTLTGNANPAHATEAACIAAIGGNHEWRCLREIQEYDGVRAPNNSDTGWFNENYDSTRYSEDWRTFLPDYEDTNKRIEDSVGRRVWDVIEGEWSYVKQDIENDNWNAEGPLEHFRFKIHDGCTPLDADGKVDFVGGETKPCGFFVNTTNARFQDSPGVLNNSMVEDHRIDIFPAWGFAPKYDNRHIKGVIGPDDVEIKNLRKGIKGEFDGMNPYWDWHVVAGLPGIFEFLIYDLGVDKGPELLTSHATIKTEIQHENPDVLADGLAWDQDVFTSIQECIRYKCEQLHTNNEGGCIPEWRQNFLNTKIYIDVDSNNSTEKTEENKGLSNWRTVCSECAQQGVVRGISRKGLEKIRLAGDITDKEYNRITTGALIGHDAGRCEDNNGNEILLPPGTTYEQRETACTGTWVKKMESTHPLAKPRIIKINGKFKEPCSKGRGIQIDMREVGYTKNEGVHLATVTELRHALAGESHWVTYIHNFNPQFFLDIQIDLETENNPNGNHLAAVFNAPQVPAATTNQTPQANGMAMPIPLNVNTSQGALKNHVKNDPDEKHKVKSKAYEIVKNVAEQWYGKKFFVPLPFDPQERSQYEKRTYGDEHQLIPSFNVTNAWEIANGGWVDPELGLDLGEHHGIRVTLPRPQKDVKYPYDLSFWDNSGLLQPFLVYPHKVWQTIETTKFENRTYMPGEDGPGKKETKQVCRKCDNGLHSHNNSEPHPVGFDANLFNKTGEEVNNGPFQTELECREANMDSVLNNSNSDPNNICNVFTQEEKFKKVELEFSPLDFSELDRNSYYIEEQRTDAPANPYCLDNQFHNKEDCTNIVPPPAANQNPDPDPKDYFTPDGLWGVAKNGRSNTTMPSNWVTDNSYLTRVWVKASVEAETYWMESDIYRYGRIVPGEGKGNCVDSNGDPLPQYADKNACEGADETWNEDKCRGSNFGDSINDNVVEQRECSQLRPFALISTDAPVRYNKNSKIGPGGWNYGGGWMAVTMGKNKTNIIDPDDPDVDPPGPEEEGGQSAAMYGSEFTVHGKMAPAAFKPWDAAVPQISNVESWGPWSAGEHFGKVVVEEDTSLTPEFYGSIQKMNNAGKSKVAMSVEEFQEYERASVTLWGLPEFRLGAPLVAGGPYVTNITTDISAGGINTTYRMETYKRQLPAQKDWWEAEREARVFKANAQRLKSERENIVYRNRPRND
tara:strand:+ start:21706 stop:27024 length:5319 start_codon:yes stop_codon:yes gene_type:complete